MAFVDVGTTKRRSMSRGRVLRIWEAAGGRCITCGLPIDGTRDRWFIEHRIALELGGPDIDENCGPAHYGCKAEKDAADHAAAGHARRAKAQNLGIPKNGAKKLQSRGFDKAPPQRRASGYVRKGV
ncbi:HNH endonuclease [Methylobacterium terricola]|uniref:HNH endonuclease n=1 Tax=Methylobacterium terricola TaxID=2583531 RepID=A0A5C4LPV8_9HYPH|nr:HNH endonuclease [Methylobacterium terricola]TNC14872.1 HNH endonuclease [Methylobacterium terricola]